MQKRPIRMTSDDDRNIGSPVLGSDNENRHIGRTRVHRTVVNDNNP